MEKAETEEARRETIRDFGGLVLAGRGYIVVALSPRRWTPIDDESGGRAVEEEWVDGNCCFISDSANLARLGRPCLLPNYERERIRRASSPLEKGEASGETPWDDAGREEVEKGRGRGAR